MRDGDLRKALATVYISVQGDTLSCFVSQGTRCVRGCTTVETENLAGLIFGELALQGVWRILNLPISLPAIR